MNKTEQILCMGDDHGVPTKRMEIVCMTPQTEKHLRRYGTVRDTEKSEKRANMALDGRNSRTYGGNVV